MTETLTPDELRILMPVLPADSEVIYWQTETNLALDRRFRPELDRLADALHAAAVSGSCHLFQRRRGGRLLYCFRRCG